MEHEHPSIKVIAALGAAALASSDADLLEAVTAELASAPGDAGPVLSAAALAKSDEPTAISALEAAAAARPFDSAALNRLASAYVAAGKSGPAVALLQRTGFGSADDAAEADRLRGIALTLEGEEATMEKGIESLQRAIMLRPWDAGAWEALAWAKRVGVELES